MKKFSEHYKISFKILMDSGRPNAVPPRVGPYNIRGNIGTGAFSIVKLAQHVATREFYACKIISKTCFHKESFASRFETEIRVMQQMNHPNIVELNDVFQDSQFIYIFMEFCPNGELFQYIVDHRFLPESEAKIFLKQIINGLKYIHSNHATHRDIKPENILLDKFGNLKISDFGFARFVDDSNLVSTSCGSPCYAAPECLEGKSYNAYKCDIWSTGVILFAMLSGTLPWTKRNQKELFQQIKNGEYKIPTFLSGEAQDLISKMMCTNPDDRIDDDGILNHPWLDGADDPIVHPKESCIVSLKKIDGLFNRNESIFEKKYDDNGLRKLKKINLSFKNPKIIKLVKEITFPESYIKKPPQQQLHTKLTLPPLHTHTAQDDSSSKSSTTSSRPLAIDTVKKRLKENGKAVISQRANMGPKKINQIKSAMSVRPSAKKKLNLYS
ncbi:CAMK family protein kinase [Tritrichomonas foetus]|uniref:CAMK family protein kinase n=1 Tax=Tritrichomonas foetus TaxID=1144522 RepID=A0A1J4JUT5_9EUKA|nr:CAMK family protein kinase [Tritrichomonas foetus]|eukprot:OHT02763.1 CAMK family protein kinase [Tritrichomonas foetus]